MASVFLFCAGPEETVAEGPDTGPSVFGSCCRSCLWCSIHNCCGAFELSVMDCSFFDLECCCPPIWQGLIVDVFLSHLFECNTMRPDCMMLHCRGTISGPSPTWRSTTVIEPFNQWHSCSRTRWAPFYVPRRTHVRYCSVVNICFFHKMRKECK